LAEKAPGTVPLCAIPGYQREIREGYLEQARSQPDKYLVVDSTAQPEAVFAALTAGITHRLHRD
jgi:thymidylate kinase